MLGQPIAHSLSPVLHGAAYAALGLPVHYGRVDLGGDEVLAWLRPRLGTSGGAAPGGGEDWLGVSVTMPLKAAVVAAAGELSPRVREIGVANTLVRCHPDHPGELWAHNTDVDGIVCALADAGLDTQAAGGVVGVLGNGGTATAAVAAAALIGAEAVALGVRDAGRAGAVLDLAGRLGLRTQVLDQPSLMAMARQLRALVSTLPPRAADPLAVHVASAGGGRALLPPLLDAAYDPWPSALAGAWVRAGGAVASGLSMLLHQGVEQVRLFTERPRRDAGVPEPDWAAVTVAAAEALGVVRA
ncbi:shikimate dehydrogenase [Micrococcus sp.]|uniref:shikimate dehydrogenase family protein n=1 Tax=Micrococcus sp. TaxID=1271 RepID=UPI002A909623|nr:shikimate dehydrogenase [Micrococcus sp.]MDY6055472.1 shikimate dehydrogenase [Micrococcus sp.]